MVQCTTVTMVFVTIDTGTIVTIDTDTVTVTVIAVTDAITTGATTLQLLPLFATSTITTANTGCAEDLSH